MAKPGINHPDSEMLAAFLDGTLLMGFSVAVSAHVAGCEPCRSKLGQISESVSSDWYEEIDQEWDVDLSDVLNEIVEHGDIPCQERSVPVTSHSVKMRDRTISLPKLLADLSRNLDWKEIASGIHQGLVDLDSKTKFEFIYMEPGARVPMHTHLGREVMLVLDGDISDNLGEYAVSDFVLLDQSAIHGQTTQAGCICLFVTDAPLIFKEGIARLVNPINYIKHWLNTASK